jgi:hypothetical protein
MIWREMILGWVTFVIASKRVRPEVAGPMTRSNPAFSCALARARESELLRRYRSSQ